MMRATPISRSECGPSMDACQRILFLNHAAVIGGAELVLRDVAKPFRESSEVVLFEDGPFQRILAADGIAVRVMNAGNAMLGVRREHALPPVRAAAETAVLAVRLARRARAFDMLYANSQKAFVVACGAGILARRPVLWHLHDVLSEEHFSSVNIRLGVALANRSADRILAVSQSAANAFVAQGGDASKVFVVHTGVDARPFAERPGNDIAALRADLGLNGHRTIGSFSRLAPWKGQHVLLDALPLLPQVHVVFAGDPLFGHGDYLGALTDRAHALRVSDRVHFLGHRTDVPLLMQAVDVVVHSPTAPEPFGRVIAEAMLAGTPIVAARSGGPLEIIREGIDGLFFEPGRADDLARVLTELFANPYRAGTLAKAARETARARYTRDTMIHHIANHLDELGQLPR